MKTFKLYILIILISVCSCDNYVHNGLNTLFLQKIDVKTIPAFPELNDFVMNPFMFSIGNNYLAIYEPNMDSLVIIEERNSKHIKRIIPKGQGPKDLVSIEDISYDNNIFHFLSFRQKKVLKFDEHLCSLSEDSLINDVLVQNTCSTGFASDGDYYFFPLLNNDNRFLLTTQSSKIVFGALESTNDFSSQDLGWILQSKYVLNKNSKRLFWASGMGDVYGIYDYSNPNNVESVIQNIFALPETLGPGERGYTNHTALGTASITSSSDYVFLLYSGQTMGTIFNLMIKAEALYDSNTILVFDWEGNPVKQLNVDHKLRCISFDSTTNKLYGVELNDDSEYSLCEIPIQ